MHFSPVFRRDVLILGRSVFGVLLPVRQSLVCIDPPEELFYSRPYCFNEIGVAWTGYSRKGIAELTVLEGPWLLYVPRGLILNVVHFTGVHVSYNKPLFPNMEFVG